MLCSLLHPSKDLTNIPTNANEWQLSSVCALKRWRTVKRSSDKFGPWTRPSWVPEQQYSRRTSHLAAVGMKGNAALVSDLREFGFAKDFAERYELGRTIGAGTFGTVYFATERATGREVAVKVITKRFLSGFLERQFVTRVQHEVDVYNHVGRSLNVAYMYGAYESNVQVQLVMELCTGGELWTRVRRGKYDEAAAAALIREILCALAQCHAKGIVLRDVKPENFLFLTPAADAALKMIDFGLATYCKPGQLLSDRAGSPLYVAPEVLKQSYGQPCDVWSAGVIAYQLLTGRFPFEDEDKGLLLSSLDVLGRKHFTNKEVFYAILYGELDFVRPPWDEISPLARDFVSSLLQRDPAIRPTAAAALQHPWITKHCSSTATSDGNDNGNGSTSDSGASPANQPLSDTLVQRLQRFGTYGRLKQLALRAVVSFMSHSESERLAALQAAFRQLDPEGRGRVPYTAVASMLTAGDWDLSPTEVSQLLSTFDIDAEENVDYNEWMAALIDWREVQESPEWQVYVNRVFDLFDDQRKGTLGSHSLKRVLCSGGGSALNGSADDDDGDWEGGEADSSASHPRHNGGGREAQGDRAVGTSGNGGEEEEVDECPFDDVVPAALREADEDSDGSISREEFLRFLATAPGDSLELYESRRRKRGKQHGLGGVQD